MIIAINSKHQTTINKFLRADSHVDQLFDKFGPMHTEYIETFAKAFDLWQLLPKREQQQIWKLKLRTGYGHYLFLGHRDNCY
jgi:hypothetical protein